MRDIKRSKAARLYAFSNWTHTYGMLVLFILVAIVSPFATILIEALPKPNELLCIPIIVIDALFIIVWCLTPEYESVEECQKLMSEREYRKRERKNRKWLM